MKPKYTGAELFFRPLLRPLPLAGWMGQLLPIPLDLLIANHMAALVTTAAAGDWRGVLTDGGFVLAFLLARQLFQVLWGIVWQKRRLSKIQDCRMLLYRRMLGERLTKLYGAKQGEMMEHIRDDFSTVTGRILDLEPNFWCALVKTIAYFVFLARQNPWIALVLAGLSAIQLLPPILVKKFLEANYLDCREIESELTDYTMQAYHGFAAIRLYNLEDWWERGLRAIHKRYIRIGNRSTVTGTVEYTMDEFTSHLLRYGSYGILGVFVLLGMAELEVALAAIALSGGFFAAVKTAADAIPNFGVSKQAAERLSTWFRENAGEISSTIYGKPSLTPETVVELRDVSLALGGTQIFHDLRSKMTLHGVTLLEGENGAGKSTMLRLLTGLLAPDEGTATIGGVESTAVSPESWPGAIFYLPQEDAAWRLTPWEVWQMVLPNPAEAVPMAERFCLTEAQYRETALDALSGGERKKVFLTLAFTLRPKLLLLDEPTNSLDDHSRRVLCEMLKAWPGNAIVISHDPIVREAIGNKIQLKDGKFVEITQTGGAIHE